MRERLSGRALGLGLLVLAAVLLVGAQIAVGALTWSETRVTDQAGEESAASIWGDKIVFEDNRNGPADEVYLYDISTDAEMRITSDEDQQWEPIIYGDKIVWNDDREADTEVFMYDLSSGVETRLTDDSVEQGEVMIHGNTVVWAQWGGASDWDIYRYNLVDGTTSLVDGGPGQQDYPDVFGDTIVYEDYGTPTTFADIAMYNLIDGQKTLITDEVANAKWNDDQYDPRIWGNTVAWYDYRNGSNTDIWYYDIAANTETRLTSDTSKTQDYCSVFRDRIAYAGESVSSEADSTVSSNIHVADLAGTANYQLTSSAQVQDYPAIWGNKVAWEDYRDGASNDVWMSRSNLEVDRAGGGSRYETSALASASHFSSAKTVVIATGTGFADALAAGGLAGCYGGPLVLTSGSALSPAARQEIERLGATDAVIVGGELAVSAAVATELEDDMGMTVSRISGASRYETAVAIAMEIKSMTGTMFEKTAFVVRGDSFPDALSVSPLAYYNRFPILLTRTDSIPAETAQALVDLDIEDAVIAGGEAAVSPGVKTALDATLAANGGSASLRWAGTSRYETSVKVAEEACAKYWAGRGFVGLAVGNNFPDALSGGAAAGREFGVLILTDTNSLPQPAKDFMTDAGHGVGWVQAFGGTVAISDAVAAEAVALTGQ